MWMGLCERENERQVKMSIDHYSRESRSLSALKISQPYFPSTIRDVKVWVEERMMSCLQSMEHLMWFPLNILASYTTGASRVKPRGSRGDNMTKSPPYTHQHMIHQPKVHIAMHAYAIIMLSLLINQHKLIWLVKSKKYKERVTSHLKRIKGLTAFRTLGCWREWDKDIRCFRAGWTQAAIRCLGPVGG